MTEWIAERKLLFAPKGSFDRNELLIRIGRPYLIDSSAVNFQVPEGAGGCTVEFVGLDSRYLDEVYGADLLQALQLAADVEPTLKRLHREYNLFFPSGEPYFDDSDNN